MLRSLHRNLKSSKQTFKCAQFLATYQWFSAPKFQPAQGGQHKFAEIRHFSSIVKDPDDKDTDEIDSDTEIEMFELETQTPVKNLLYPTATDSKIVTLKECGTVDDILQTASPASALTKEQTVQAILSLWDHLKDDRNVSFFDFRESPPLFLKSSLSASPSMSSAQVGACISRPPVTAK